MKKKITLFVFSVFCCLSFAAAGLSGQETTTNAVSSGRAAIDINLIIDGSSYFTNVKEEVSAWVVNRLDHIIAQGDKVTVWNAGQKAKIVYTGKMENSSDIDTVKKIITEFSVPKDASTGSADFSGALEGAALQTAQASSGTASVRYTLLISASPAALSSLLSGTQAELLRFSKVEEFSGWRALVVGLNLEEEVKQAAAVFFGS